MKKTVYFLLLCVAVTMFSCSEDDLRRSDNHDSHHHVKKIEVSFGKMQQFLKEHTGGILPISLDPALHKGDDYITAIDTTGIVLITDGSVTSFTLHINTLDDELYTYSNLVIKSHDGQVEEYVLHYNPTPEWQAAFDTGEKLPYEGELMITDIYGEETTRIGGDNCMLIIEVACYGSSCPCTDGNGQTFYVPVACGGGGGGGSSNGGYPGNNGPLNPGAFPPTDPNPGSGGGYYSDFDYFMMDLTSDQQT